MKAFSHSGFKAEPRLLYTNESFCMTGSEIVSWEEKLRLLNFWASTKLKESFFIMFPSTDCKSSSDSAILH